MLDSVLDKKTYRTLVKIKTSLIPLRMYDLKNKTEILAVKTGLKSCFLYTREESSTKELSALKQVAVLLKLKSKTTINPPLYFSREPNVKSNFLKAYYHQNLETLWIYQNPTIEEKIEDCIKGRLNEGYLLGYPQCCVKWHMGYRTLETESIFQDIENFIVKNPFALSYCQAKNEEDLYTQLLSMNYPKEENQKVWKVINQELLETYRLFPYVPHWACPDCLSCKNKETQKLNTKYEKLLTKIDPKFRVEFLNATKKAVIELEKADS